VAELLIELLVELLAEPLLTLLGRAFAALLPAGWREARGPVAAGYFLLGCLAGALSLLIWPTPLLHDDTLRALCFVLSPLLCGLTLLAVGARQQRRGRKRSALDSAWFGVLLGLAYQLVRVVWAT
jgi:hypothetical protein